MKGLEKCGVDVVRRCTSYCGIVVVPIIMQPSSYGILGVRTEFSQRVQGRLRVEELWAQPPPEKGSGCGAHRSWTNFSDYKDSYEFSLKVRY